MEEEHSEERMEEAEDLSSLDPTQLKELIQDQTRLFSKVMNMNRFAVLKINQGE